MDSHKSGIDQPNDNGRQSDDDVEGQGDFIDEADILQVIDIDENQPVGEFENEPALDDMEGDLEGADDDEDMVAARNDATVIFDNHKESVFCVAIDPVLGQLAASGGSDDKARFWNVADGSEAFVVEGHTDSVTHLGFSHDGSYAATGDMAGGIKVWDVKGRKEVWQTDIDDLEFLLWHFGAHVLLAGDKSGVVWMWKIPSGDCRTFPNQGVSPLDGRILPDGERLAVGYSDGTLRIWNLKTQMAMVTFEGNDSHQDEVTCLTVHPDSSQPLLFSGSIDCTAALFNYNTGKALGKFDASRPANSSQTTGQGSDTENSVEAVALFKDHPLGIVGTVSGEILVFHLPSKTLKHRLPVPGGVVRLIPVKPCAEAPLLFSANLEGTVQLWDVRAAKILNEWMGHSGPILDMVSSKDNNTVVTAGDDGTALVFIVQEPER